MKAYDAEQRPCLGWLGVSSPTGDNKGDRYLEFFDVDMNFSKTPKSYVLDKGDIGAFETVQTVDNDGKITQTIYYTKAQTAGTDKAKEYRLKCVVIEPKIGNIGDYNFKMRFIDYDLSLPASDFHAVNLGGYLFLYWISAETKKKDSDPDVWRITGVYLNPNSSKNLVNGSMSDQVVLAEFTLPEAEFKGKKYKSVPFQVRLTDSNTGYITAKPDTGDEKDRAIAPITLYSFPVKLTPAIDLKKAALMETTVVQGDFITTDISVMNEGSIGISSLDVELWLLENGAEKKKVETLHVDCNDPGKSKLVLHDAKGDKTVAEGDKAFYRYKEYNYGARQREWNVSQETHTLNIKNGDQFSLNFASRVSDRITTNTLVPGALACFNGSIKIPANWAGNYDLRLKVTNLTALPNWAGTSVAPASKPKGAGRSDQAVLNQELVYQLDEASGRLVLQRDLIPKGEEDDTLRLYPESIEAPEPVVINCDIHDIDVSHRLYYDAYGEEMLDIILYNHYHNTESIELTCAVYVNGSDEPYYVNLPYDPKSMSAGKTTTITLPLDVLVDTETTEEARFVITPRRIEETALVNNEFTIYPGGSSALTVIGQPASTRVRAGGSASYAVDVYGGEGDYTYQWQVLVNGKWQNIPGATGDTLSLEHVRPEWNGRRTRCIIADGGREIRVNENGDPIVPTGEEGHYVISSAAQLTVIGGSGTGDAGESDHPDTGDHADLPLYLAVAFIALALLALIRRRSAH